MRLSFDPIGKLRIQNIYEYYDEPLVFSFYSETGALYLANLVDGDDDVHIWTYLPITNKELLAIESQQISLFNLYKNSTSSYIYILTEKIDSKDYQTISMNSFPKEYLPDKDSFLDFTRNQNTTLGNIQVIEKRSTESNRYVVDLSLEPNQSHEHEIEANLLGKTLIDFQELVQAIGAPKHLLKQAAISDEIRQENRLKVTNVFAASFGVRMESDHLANAFSDDPIRNNLESLITMLNGINDYEGTLNYLNSFSQKSKYKFLSFIELIKDNKIDGKISLAVPQGSDFLLKTTNFKEKEAVDFYKKAQTDIDIKEQEIILDGSLLAFDSKVSSFKFASSVSGNDIIYSGKLSEKITDSTSSIPSNGIATILVETKTKIFTGEESHKYTLQSWSPNM